MKIDFHTHTRKFSTCSNLSVDEPLKLESEAGVEGVVLTEHEQFWPEKQFERLQKQYSNLVLFNGAEVSAGSLHHVLTILPEPAPDLLSFDDPQTFVDRVRSIGGYLIAAHPFRFYDDYERRNQSFSLDGVEIASRGMYRPEEEGRARELARTWDAECFSNSDAHSPSPVGAFYCEVDDDPRTERELLDTLRSNHVRPIIKRTQFRRDRYS